MLACINYHPEGYSLPTEKLMGRHAAGASFLRAFFLYAKHEESIYAKVGQASHAKVFAEQAKLAGINLPTHTITNENYSDLRRVGSLYIPGPGLDQEANNRSLYGDHFWSLCGITHTTSSAGAMDALASLLTGPVQTWDALICTSTAVKKNVEVVLQAQADYLKHRLGATKFTLPQLPVIPLGIHTGDFFYSESQRDRARDKLGITSEQIVVLYTGRLSFHGKAHPVAMYKALEIAAQSTNKNVVLIECGWHANNHIAEAFSEAAAHVSPSVRVINLDGRDADNRDIAWASADVFCSLSDNIQETFGIVPLEAMAAGLPVVVSDWDGYKDTVRNGIDGFRIPTLAAGPGLAGDLALRHALNIDSYDMYIGHSSSLVSIDIAAAATGFEELFRSPELRRKMGDAGRERAQNLYDWRVIIPRYEELWDELADRRRVASKDNPKATNTWPARLDPTISFEHYPTSHLALNTKLRLATNSPKAATEQLAGLKALKMVNYAELVFPTNAEIEQVLANASIEPTAAEALIEGVATARRPYVFRGLVWLLKIGILQLA